MHCRTNSESTNKRTSDVVHNIHTTSIQQCTEQTLSIEFTALTDSTLIRCSNGLETYLQIGLYDSRPRIEARNLIADTNDPCGACNLTLLIEDAFGLTDGVSHTLTITCGTFGTRFYIDGYQCFASATNLGLHRLQSDSTSINVTLNNQRCFTWNITRAASWTTQQANSNDTVTSVQYTPTLLTPETIASSVIPTTADICFAGPTLAERDLRKLEHAYSGSMHLQFRLRGPKQNGILFEAGSISEANQPLAALTMYAGPEGIRVTIRSHNTVDEFLAEGTWDDGEWHDCVVRSCFGFFDLYIDGFSQVHHIGQFWFGDIVTEREHLVVSIGQSLAGIRLMGEIRCGGIFHTPITDGTIKGLSHTIPLTTTALFDTGYAGSRNYRIPSLITTSEGTLIAGADQRTCVANDAPNHINFVIRRSFDQANSWKPMQTVIKMPQKEDERLGASAIDSCPINDPLRQRKRITILIDLNPGGIGLTNCETGVGVTSEGDIKLTDRNGTRYSAHMDGSCAIDLDGMQTPYEVFADGSIRDQRNTENATTSPQSTTWNVWRSPLTADDDQPLFAVPTTYIAQIYSDDDGVTWSHPQLIDHMVKEPWMRFAGVCPGNGIVLRYGQHAGRLLAPFYCSGDSRVHYSSGALISDDDGATWRRGQFINENRIINGVPIDPQTMHDDDATSSETVFIERANGDILAFFRNQHHSGRVGKAVSHDGGETWDTLVFDPALPEIFSQPNATMLPGNNPDHIAFANASQMMPYRGRGVIRISTDGGKTWTNNICVNPFHHVYQCMSATDTTLELMWEIETAGIYITTIPCSLWSKQSYSENKKP